jgi:cytochrome c553
MCHGPDAHGQGPIPRLAGQHADYVFVQLKFIQSGIRAVDQMQALIANLNDADFKAVAAYVQTLN